LDNAVDNNNPRDYLDNAVDINNALDCLDNAVDINNTCDYLDNSGNFNNPCLDNSVYNTILPKTAWILQWKLLIFRVDRIMWII
jgi:hypothetical protein